MKESFGTQGRGGYYNDFGARVCRRMLRREQRLSFLCAQASSAAFVVDDGQDCQAATSRLTCLTACLTACYTASRFAGQLDGVQESSETSCKTTFCKSLRC